MPKMVLLQWLVIISCVCLKVHSDNTISVDPSSGRDDSQCLVPFSGLQCATLSYALRYANHSTLYLLSVGDHSLTASEPNTLANVRNITIASNGTSSTVRCARNAGLSFENVSSLVIESVVFLGCGTLHNSTSRNRSDSESAFALLKIAVALYFHLCDSVILRYVTVTNSSAMGVLMYDTTGKNLILNSAFSYNVAQDHATPGGGGFSIEFTYSSPGDICAPSPLLQHNTGSMYDFVNSTFSGNVADDGSAYAGPKRIIPYACNHDAFGKGGGLALFFKGTASGNTVRLSNCTFQNNKAVWGGGLYTEFHDAAMGNVIEIESTFLNNSAAVEGGGLRVVYYTPGYNRNKATNNFSLSSSTFVDNNAFMGGATALLPSLLSADDSIPEILVSNCTFESNEAELGSAVYGSYITLSSVNLVPFIAFQMCNFINNFLELQMDRRITEPYIGIGAVYLNGIHAKFYGIILFANNSGSALAVVGAYVDFSSSNVSFVNNTGDKGGGISLLGDASILISNQTNVRFEGNRVSTYGGAIYNSYIEIEPFTSYPNCFIHYNDFLVPPDKWTAHFIFRNNIATIVGNSIYSTSILPCSLFTDTPNESTNVFCWNQTFWNYGNNCTDEIGTGFGKLSARLAQTFPGFQYKLPITIIDELGHDILGYTPFIPTIGRQDPQPGATVDPGFYVAVDGVVQINGNGSTNQTFILTLEGTGTEHWQSDITVQLLPCPPGFSQDTNNRNATCKCDPGKTYNSIVVCLGANSAEGAALIKVGYWIGFAPEPSSAELVVAVCPQGFCKPDRDTAVFGLSGTYVRLPLHSEVNDSVVCTPNREGIVCGKCTRLHAPAINDDAYSCVPCDPSQLLGNTFKYIGIVYVPMVVFFLVIILFNIKLTTGPANAFILFSQVIVSSFSVTVSDQLTASSNFYSRANEFLSVCSFVYRIFNLDFFAYLLEPFCIGTELSTLDIIELNYLVAIVPCVMILIVMACYRIKTMACILKVCRCNTGRMISQTRLTCIQSINVSPILAFAAFLLLSYNKFSTTSSKIFRQVHFRIANGSEIGGTRSFYAAQYDLGYWRYSMPSSIITALIFVLPIILLGFPVRMFEKCISRVPAIMKHYPADKVNIFLDAFQGCFKDNRRYFASAYIFFRLAINVFFVFLPISAIPLSEQSLCIGMVVLIAFLQPYKVTAFNYIDILIFSNLALISILNEYIIQYSSDLSKLDSIDGILVILGILISLPVIYMTGYLIWQFLILPRKDKIVSTLLSSMQKYLNQKSRVEINTKKTLQAIRCDDQGNVASVDVVTTAADDIDAFDERVREQVSNAGISDTAFVDPSN